MQALLFFSHTYGKGEICHLARILEVCHNAIIQVKEGIMPISDLFKKSSKPEPPKRPSQEALFGSPALQKNRADAATEVMGIFDRHFRTPEGIHAGTVLAAGAWLAGTSLYRSFGYPQTAEPGTVMLSEKANQAFPKLLDLFTYYMFQGGTQIKPEQFILQTPDAFQPRKTILQIQEAHQDEYNTIMKRHKLDYLDGARAGVIVCAMLFNYHCVKRKDLDPRLGAGIISMGIVTGAKTVPMPLKPESPALAPAQGVAPQNSQLAEVIKSIATNSIDGSGERLILGEGMTPMQAALMSGGKYILVHPEVVRQLQLKNIDAFLVYEAALQMEMESRISRIELVGGQVEQFLQAWNGRPQHQTPIHVRQVLWLVEHAKAFGYERNGNSWIRKP
jgi:hypothetical protein